MAILEILHLLLCLFLDAKTWPERQSPHDTLRQHSHQPHSSPLILLCFCLNFLRRGFGASSSLFQLFCYILFVAFHYLTVAPFVGAIDIEFPLCQIVYSEHTIQGEAYWNLVTVPHTIETDFVLQLWVVN